MALSGAETSHDHTPSYHAQLHCGLYGRVHFGVSGPTQPRKSQLDFRMCPDQIVLYDQNEMKLDIPEQGVTLESGWSITPIGTTVISRSQLRPDRRVPCCKLCVKWTRPEEHPTELCYRIKLLGAKPPGNFIMLKIEPPSQPPLGTSTLNLWYPSWWEAEVTMYAFVLAKQLNITCSHIV